MKYSQRRAHGLAINCSHENTPGNQICTGLSRGIEIKGNFVITKLTSPSTHCPNLMQNDQQYSDLHNVLPTSHTAAKGTQVCLSIRSTAISQPTSNNWPNSSIYELNKQPAQYQLSLQQYTQQAQEQHPTAQYLWNQIINSQLKISLQQNKQHQNIQLSL